MSTFKVGDRVRIIKGYRRGQEGTITHIHNTGRWPYYVQADDKSFTSPRAADELAYATAFDPDPEPAFKVGDRVRTHTEPRDGDFHEKVGTIVEVFSQRQLGYDCTVALTGERSGLPIVFRFSELTHVAEWEKDLLTYGVSRGSIYDEVVKAHGFDPMAGEGY